ncbi:MFS transporter [Cryobacterium breve]|uniref:MFS transporter n=1 Tax=Cryobacterium breve TaxID=1259258 RepID=UPI00248B9074|nr:MFS transporter [Cryobacterium breve]
MNTTITVRPPATLETVKRLPLATLIALAVIGFVLVAMETMPAGLLPVIAAGMGTSEGTVGLFVSAYALGTVIVTIPAITLTRGMRRKPLLLGAILGLIVANSVTALSSDVALSLLSRFVAGAFSGIIWGMLAAYGRKISPPSRAGLSLAIVSGGAPVGFALGTPLGSWLGTTFDWRWAFAGLTAVAVIAGALIAAIAPDAHGQPGSSRLPLVRVFRIPGIAIILAVIFTWMLAHNTIYTYLSPYLRSTSGSLAVDVQALHLRSRLDRRHRHHRGAPGPLSETAAARQRGAVHHGRCCAPRRAHLDRGDRRRDRSVGNRVRRGIRPGSSRSHHNGRPGLGYRQLVPAGGVQPRHLYRRHSRSRPADSLRRSRPHRRDDRVRANRAPADPLRTSHRFPRPPLATLSHNS